MIDLGGFSFDMEEDDTEKVEIKESSLQDIAVIGMSVCLPGADDIDQLWERLAEGADLVIPFPEQRKQDISDYARKLGLEPNIISYFKGAYLPEIDKFDYPFFRLSPREAGLMNPNQRLFLETAWKAIEDAGYGGGQLKGSKTGVFLGYSGDAFHDYKKLIDSLDPSGISIAVPGNLSSVIASRISYLLDLKGPAITVDTACSSSLVAIHLACQALRSGDCDTALAGSVKTLIFPADTGMRIGIESSDGRAKPFDHGSDGTGMGEGTGAVLLKPLARAIADGDSVYAVIKGSAVNQDGSSIGISAPNVAAQEEVIVEAWMNAGVDPATVSYIEAHGTGTKLGDPIEIEGINRAFRKFTQRRQFCAVGSVKSNLGHLDNAAGIVGLVKACLALHRKQLPPSLHFNRPNANVDFIDSAVYVNRRLSVWESEGQPRRCGVSSFGLSGTNCHVVLEEADEIAVESIPTMEWKQERHLFTLSAQSHASLSLAADAYIELLEQRDHHYNLVDICYTANTGRDHYKYRIAMVVSSVDELIQSLKDYKEHSLSVDAVGSTSEALMSDIDPTTTGSDLSLYQWRDLYLQGATLPWNKLYPYGTYRRVHLPSYQFDKHRCWVETTSSPVTTTASQQTHNQEPIPSAKQVIVKLTGGDESYTQLEQIIGNVWAGVLGFKELSVESHFYSLGGDSILAYQIAVKLSEQLGVTVKAVDVIRCETIAKLAAYLEQSSIGITGTSISETEKIEVTPSAHVIERGENQFPLTSSQLRIFVQEEAGGIGTGYNMPLAFRVTGEIDPDKLRHALGELIRRHDALRTTFVMDQGQPVQVVQAEAELKLELLETGDDGIQGVLARFVRPFDLRSAPLFRAGLVSLDRNEHVLMIDSHHLISDGFSTAILVREFFELYQEGTLPPPVFQYRDYIEWRMNYAESEDMLLQEEFWKHELGCINSPLRLPLDHPRPKVKTFAGKNLYFDIETSTVQALWRAAAKNDTTPNMLLTALYGLTILKYGNQQEAVIGSIVSGRQRPGEDSCVGMFINYIPLRLRIEEERPIQQFVDSAKATMLNCYEHQDVAFETMIEYLKEPVDRSRNPIYDTMMVFHNEYRLTGSDRMTVGGLLFEPLEFPVQTATLDVKLDVFMTGEGHLKCHLNYNVDLFEERTMLRFIQDFQRVIRQYLEDPQLPARQLSLFTSDEAEEMAARRGWNDHEQAHIAKKRVVVNATFTSEPLEGYLRWWVKEFGLTAEVEFGGYNQVFQQLLSPSDQLAGGDGCRVMLVRFEDLIGGVDPENPEVYIELERQFSDLLGIIEAADKPVPYVFGIFRPASHLGYPTPLITYLDQLYNRWRDSLQRIDQVYTVDFREAEADYSVSEVFDPVTDRAGHMPFTDEFYAVMGTTLARKVTAIFSAPFKVIVLDCDNTLWQGVCGEEGPLGVRIEAPHLLLQQWMLERAREGQLLTICSKNNEADVWAVFEQNPQMLLKKEHFVHWKINWLPKSENIRQIAKELNLGIDSVVFIDDNPLECSEVMQNAPDVLTLRLPADLQQMSIFLKHIWAWDRVAITEEDRMRARMYTEERNRRLERESASLSMEDFLHGLELKMSMRTLDDSELVRAAQLTQRTNQFNLNGIRRTEEELHAFHMLEHSYCWVVEASDRFGDYGIVGVVLAVRDPELMRIDSFLLSCRVLGRGIEDAIMDRLKQVAAADGLTGIKLEYRQTSKNEPFLAFLNRIGWNAGSVMPLRDVAEGPGYVKVYFECSYEKRNTSSEVVEQKASPSIITTSKSVNPHPIAPTAGEQVHWNPTTHWMSRHELEEALATIRHRAYLLAVYHSHTEQLLQLPVYETVTIAESTNSNRELQYESPSTTTELKLAELWKELLKVEVPGIHAHFFDMGGNSLKAATLVSKIHQAFGVELSIGDLFADPTLRAMAARIEGTGEADFVSITPIDKREYYPVLSAQKRLFLLHEMQEGLEGYNMPGVFVLEGEADISAMESALRSLISRHESLRTSFAWRDGEIVQIVHDDAPLQVNVFDSIPDGDCERIIAEFMTPFRLSEPPLLRAGYIRTFSGKQLIMFDMHHIISDGVSLGNLLRDFARLYQGEDLPPLTIQVKDYAVWQQHRMSQGAMENHRRFWMKLLSGAPALELPVQGSRLANQNEGATYTFRIDGALREQLEDYALDRGATLFMVLLSAYNVLLSKYSGQEDIVVGTPVAGRHRPELEPLIGMFVNTLALRSYPAQQKTFDLFVTEIRDLTISALKHQDYPFEMLIQELHVQPEAGRNPLFDTMFAMQNMEPFQLKFGDAGLSAYPFDFGVSRFDLTLQAREMGEHLEFILEYKTAVFSTEDAHRLAAHYAAILEQAVNKPEVLIEDIVLLGEEERAGLADRIRASQSLEFAEFDF